MIHVVAPNKWRAHQWCRENGVPLKGMRWISRPDQLEGATGEVVIVDRGVCTGTVWAAVRYALELEAAGRVSARIAFTA